MRTRADLYPILKEAFEADPNATSIDIYGVVEATGTPMFRVTRDDFERERLRRDMFLIMPPHGKQPS